MSDTICPRCFVGNLHNKLGSYHQMLGGSLLSIPEIPIHQCDICGYTEYTLSSLEWIATLTYSPNEAQSDNAAVTLTPSHPDDRYGVRKAKP